VVFTVIHSDTSVEEKIEIPLSNITPNILLKLNKLVHKTFPKPERILIPDFTRPGHRFALVTSYEALMFLRENKLQRGLKLSACDRYGQEHREGKWLLTNQGIGFDVNGQDLDGQHRLFTIILEGKPMPLLLVWGLDPAARKVVDCGIGRTIGQVHDMMHGRADDLPAGPVMSQYTTKLYLLHGGTTNKARLYFDPIREFYVDDMAWFYRYTRQHSPCHSHAKTAMITTSAIPTAFLMIHHAFPAKAEEFAEAVFSQKCVLPGTEVLRDYLNTRVEKHDEDDFLDITFKILRSFYAFLDNESVKQLRAVSEEPKNKMDRAPKAVARRKQLAKMMKRLWDECALLPQDALNSISIRWDANESTS
jgi:hypothetical protein